MTFVEDASGFRGEAEEVVAPQSEAGVIAFLRSASHAGRPVTIGGARTGVTGGGVPLEGALLSIEKLKRLDILDGYAIAGPGVALADLHAAASASGQFYPPDPTETTASVGGTIATNASGARSFRYGDTRRRVLGLRAVLMNGRLLDVRRGDTIDFPVPALPIPHTTKYTAGYRLSPGMDWIDLLVGSEGTLAVVTETMLRLLPEPKAFLAGVVFFPGDRDAVDAVEAWRGEAGARMLEYFDKRSLDLLRAGFPEIPSAAGAAILFEDETGDIDCWYALLTASRALLRESWFATTSADRERFRRFRHALPELVNARVRRNGFLKLGSDYAVPVERNREMLDEYRRRLEGEFDYVIFGHIGDAHLHVNILPASEEQFARGQALMIEFARHAVSLGGTVSAEHGLGKRKAHLLKLQYTPDQIEAMKQVKRRLDPQWLLGRGTLFPL